MGYLSDVLLVLDNAASKQLEEQLENLPKNTKERVQKLLNSTDNRYIAQNSNARLYYWKWIKWYIEFTEVCFIEDFIDNLDENNYLIIVIGEELTDLREQGTFYDNPFHACLERNIKFKVS